MHWFLKMCKSMPAIIFRQKKGFYSLYFILISYETMFKLSTVP